MSIAIEIATEIARLQTAKQDIKTAIENKGVTVPAGTLLSGFAPLIGNIATGGGGGGLQFIFGQVPPEALYKNSEFTITGLPGNPTMVYIFYTISGAFDVTEIPMGALFYVRIGGAATGSNVISVSPAFNWIDSVEIHWLYENGSLTLQVREAGAFWSVWYDELPVYYVMVV